MKKIKVLFYTLILASAVSFVACDDEFLDKVDPNSSTPDSFFISVDAVESALFATYATEANVQNYSRQGFWFTDMPADDVASKDPSWSYDSFQFEPGDGNLIRIWRVWNYMTNRASQTIRFANNLQDDGGETARVNQIVAEAKFLRGLYHYFLAMHFGNVPYKTEDNLDDPYLPVTPRATILEGVVADIESALPNLLSKDAQPTDQYGRATKGAANTLLARVKLAQQDWPGAEAAATAVINDNYSLLTDLRQIHHPFNPFNDESIYEIVFTFTGGGNHDWSTGGGGNSPTAKSSFRSFWNYRPGRPGSEGHRASDKLIASYDADDPRLIAYYFGPTSIVDGGPHDFAGQGWTISKFIDETNSETRDTQENFMLFRLADVILMRAEARAMQGNITGADGALADLNMIRERAREGNAAVVPDVTTTVQADVIQAIKDERFRELSAEVVRMIDIRRWGDFDELSDVGFRSDRDQLLPIPQSEIDNNININENNPGW